MYGYGTKGYTEYWKQNRKTRDEVVGMGAPEEIPSPAGSPPTEKKPRWPPSGRWYNPDINEVRGFIEEGRHSYPPVRNRPVVPGEMTTHERYKLEGRYPPAREAAMMRLGMNPETGQPAEKRAPATVAPSRPEDAGAVAGQPTFKPKRAMKRATKVPTGQRARRMAQAGVGTNVPSVPPGTITAGTGRPYPTPERVDRDFEARNKTATPVVEAIRGTDRTFYDPLTDQEYLTKQEALGFPARLTKEDMINLEKENIRGRYGVKQQKIVSEATKTAAATRAKGAVEAAKLRPSQSEVDKYVKGVYQGEDSMINQRTGLPPSQEAGGQLMEDIWSEGGDERSSAGRVLSILDGLNPAQRTAYFMELRQTEEGLARLKILQRYDNLRKGK
jgi:hypothetical protein